MPRLRKSILLVVVRPYFSPGSRNASPLPLLEAAVPSMSERLKWNFASTSTTISAEPVISRNAFTICTQVVPFMPPTVT